jgi:hypothetical protein
VAIALVTTLPTGRAQCLGQFGRMFLHVHSYKSHRKLRLGPLPIGKGGQPDAMREGLTQCSQPADPTDPGDAADLGIPQGLEIRLDVAVRLISAAFRLRTLCGAAQVAIHLVSKSSRNSSSTLRGMVTIGARCVAILEGLAM